MNSSYDLIYANDKVITFSGRYDKDKPNDIKNTDNLVFDRMLSTIIEEFINNNVINSVQYDSLIKDDCYRTFVESASGKRIIIDRNLSDDDLFLIMKKYFHDRETVLNNSLYDRVEFIPGQVSSSKYSIENDSLKLYLATKGNYNSFEEFDLVFIKNIIDKFFENQIIFIRSIVEGSVLSFCLVSEESDMVIKLTNMVNYNNIIYSMIKNHNNSINNNINKKYLKKGDEYNGK